MQGASWKSSYNILTVWEGKGMKELVIAIAKALVDKPELVDVKEVTGESTSIFELRVDSSDRGKIIGKEGRIISAIRTIISSAGAKLKKRITIEIVED